MRRRTILRPASLTPLQSLIQRRWRPQWTCPTCSPYREGSPHRRSFYTTPRREESKTASLDERKPFYVTTPIFYVNAAPHVGHMYTMIIADVLARWKALQNHQTRLLTGTDEHGMKIQRAAAQAGIAPQEFCNKGAGVFQELAAKVEMSNDIFIRTTDSKHKNGVEHAWHVLREMGFIYESQHQGWYSVSDETFYPEQQVQLVVDPPTGRKIMASIETGKEVEWTSERNYHFKLSAFRDKLLQFYSQNPNYIVPKSRMDEVVSQVETGLEDLSISRPTQRLSWGVRVPDDPSQTIYVWVDALLNYATAVGFPFTPGQESATGWPPNVQVVGKDIVRFHCIYWPAFQMALELPIHKQVLTHAHWTLGKQKMAKSTGNVVNPFFALERFGVDTMRWYLIHEGGISDDADYDNSFIINKYKIVLQGRLGNLASRVLRGKGWDVPRAVKRYANQANPTTTRPGSSNLFDELDDVGKATYGRINALPQQVDQLMRELCPNRALQGVMKAVSDMNGYLQMRSPWELVVEWRAIKAFTEGSAGTQAKDGYVTERPPPMNSLDHSCSSSHHNADSMAIDLSSQASLDDVEADIDRTIFLAAETLRLVGIMLQPFMPGKAKTLLDMLGVSESRRDWTWCQLMADDSYGVPMIDLGKGDKGTLFPALSSDF